MSLAPIHTQRLVLRALTVDDTDAVFAILGHQPTVANVSFGHTTRAATERYLARRIRDEEDLGFSMWAVQLLGSAALVGLCGFCATDQPMQVELGYVIHADHWGNGYGAEAAGAAVGAAGDHGYDVIATIRPTNKRSLSVAARIGLTRTGTIEDERGQLLVWEQHHRAADPHCDEQVEQPLDGGWQTEVHRQGDVVLRSPGPQSPTVLRLLRHLEASGFDAAPRPVGSGLAPDGREQLTFIEGSSPQPHAWSDEAAWRVGHLVRSLHTATVGFDPGSEPVWRPSFTRSLPGEHPVIGHGDLGPWNILARDGLPVAFIDWDSAGPVDAQWELAEVVWLNAQLHDDDVADLNDLPSRTARIRQAALILDGYELPADQRAGFVDKMIEFAIRSARDEAMTHRVTPDTPSPAANGFPTLWAVAWRTRAAA